ncbi:MAG TPA: response regulator transcription factor [Chryseosolibacter sp.]|nr:response regulator transcription factor [Chryseosolibacter sp.]
MRVLVIEDEQAVVSFIKQGLEEQSHEVEVAYDGLIGERLALSRDYHVILLDIVIPGINGFELCKTIKAQKPQTPVMMLTTLGTTSDKVTGFEAGADDYLVKPFEFAELTARLKALSRRASQTAPAGNILHYEDLQLDTENKVAIRHNKTIMLTAKEYALLEYFIQNKGRVISRAELAEKIWDIKFDTGTNVVEVYINILRNKIDREFEKKLIHTRVGFGYFLK